MSYDAEAPRSRLRIVPWSDEVLDRIGFPATHPYVELCWAPLLGPSATLIWRRMATLAAAQPGGVDIDLGRLGADLGIPGSGGRHRRAENALERLCLFGLALSGTTDQLAVRTAVPPLPHWRLGRAGDTARRAHERFMRGRPDAENPLLGAALGYASRGWPVLPLQEGGKKPDGRLVPHGLRDATCDLLRIRAWWTAAPTANVGLRTGDSIDVIDVDGPRSVLDEAGPLPLIAGSVVATGRGWHLYFAATGLPTRAAVLPGVDVRGAGGYVVAPPSLHVSGHRYRFVDHTTGTLLDGPPAEPLAPAPDWIVELCRPKPAAPDVSSVPRRVDGGAYARAALAGECAAVASTPEGSRNDRLNRASFAAGTLVGAGALDEAAATDHLLDAARQAGLPESEARRTIDSGLGAGRDRPRQLGDGDGVVRPSPGRATAAVLARPSAHDTEDSSVSPRSPGRGVRR